MGPSSFVVLLPLTCLHCCVTGNSLGPEARFVFGSQLVLLASPLSVITQRTPSIASLFLIPCAFLQFSLSCPLQAWVWVVPAGSHSTHKLSSTRHGVLIASLPLSHTWQPLDTSLPDCLHGPGNLMSADGSFPSRQPTRPHTLSTSNRHAQVIWPLQLSIFPQINTISVILVHPGAYLENPTNALLLRMQSIAALGHMCRVDRRYRVQDANRHLVYGSAPTGVLPLVRTAGWVQSSSLSPPPLLPARKG